MAIDIGDAVRDGLRRLGAPGGGQLLAAFAVVVLASTVRDNASLANMRTADAAIPASAIPATPLAVDLPPAALTAVGVALAFATEAVYVVGVRSMVAADPGPIAARLATRRLPRATVDSLLAGVAVKVAVVAGLVLFVFPGLYLAGALAFTRQEVAVEDRGAVAAMRESWALTDGDRAELAVLVALLSAVVFAGVYLPWAVGLELLPEGSLVPWLVLVANLAVLKTVGVAVVSRAYAQATGDGATETTGGDDEWNDPPGVDI